ncbi:MAG: hypothetical protein ABI551_06845, partial [Polyangiaceae bacterium]
MRRPLFGLSLAFPLSCVAFASWAVAACSSSSNGAGPGESDSGTTDGSTDSDGGTTSGGCRVTTTGSAGLLIQGRILLPSGATEGEVLIDSSGKITCADTTCASAAGYGNATVLACPGGVVSP